MLEIYGNAYSFEVVTVSSTAIGVTLTQVKPSGAPRCEGVLLTVISQPVRFCIDGSTPTALSGHVLNDGEQMMLYGYHNIINLKMIRLSSSDASVAITYLQGA